MLLNDPANWRGYFLQEIAGFFMEMARVRVAPKPEPVHNMRHMIGIRSVLDNLNVMCTAFRPYQGLKAVSALVCQTQRGYRVARSYPDIAGHSEEKAKQHRC
jgi:hypothetical protein